MDKTVKKYTSLIKRHARVALKKVRKPSEYELDDFIQEGVKILILVKRDMYDPEKKSSFKTFFTRILRQHFGGIVVRSYQHNKIIYNSEGTTVTRAQYSAAKFSHSAFDIVAMRHILEDFTPEELEYVSTVFLFVDWPVKFRRKHVRENLRISHDRERELRNSIHDKILK